MGNLLTLIREFAAYSGNGEASNNFDSVISKQEKKIILLKEEKLIQDS